MLSPPGIASVCGGDELELSCTIAGRILRWTVTQRNETMPIAERDLSDNSPRSYLRINNINTNFTFLRSSLPKTYTLLISPASNLIDGSKVSCIDRELNESLSTIINIVEDPFLGRLCNNLLAIT